MTNENAISYAVKEHAPVSARDIFGVVVRTIGLLIAIYGMYDWCWAIALLLRLVVGHFPFETHTIFGAMYFGFGVVMLRGSWIVSLAYGKG